jgi:hypothetical protein
MWRAEVTHDNDRHCEFRTGIRPTLIDETSLRGRVSGATN